MNKLIETLSKVESEDSIWLIQNLNKLDDKFTLTEFSYEYQDFCKYDGNPQTDTSSALFEAYCSYKKNQTISKCDAQYLNNRSGVLGSYYSKEEDTVLTITVKELINTYSGNTNFQKWLGDLAK